MNFDCGGLIDLHVHTTASDGTLTPTEIVKYAMSKNLRAIAITDHDTVDGLEEAVDTANLLNFEVIPGIEISVEYKGSEMHILGYYLDYKAPKLLSTLARLRDFRNDRNPRIISKLQELGCKISLAEVAAEAGGRVIGRPHIAAALFKKGYVSSKQEAFDKYLAFGQAAYVKKERLQPQEGIALILEAGGIPVLAHPLFLPEVGCAQLAELVKKLREYGLQGIEAYYPGHSPQDTGEYVRIAEKHGLLVTGGTDFHGANKPEIELGSGTGGLQIPYSLVSRMKEHKSRRGA